MPSLDYYCVVHPWVCKSIEDKKSIRSNKIARHTEIGIDLFKSIE